MKTILVTGGAGFIGSNFIRYILKKWQTVQVVNIDLLTYAGNLENLYDIEGNPRYCFVKGNICDQELVNQLFNKYQFESVVNFAAESHVDRSISNPKVFLETNVIGTQVLLDVALKHWKKTPEDFNLRDFNTNVKYLQISTDEVYGALGKTGQFTEITPLSPNSPYSASKASADMLVHAYYTTYGLPINITRCSNNYGPYQFPEKLIPLMINNCKNNIPLPIYGDGLQVRDWIHVIDHCSAIATVLENGRSGEVYNVGGKNEKANIEIVKIILKALGKDEKLISYVKDRPGHDRRYAIDNTKITSQLGWHPKYSFEQGIQDTIDWYCSQTEWMNHIASGKYQKLSDGYRQ